LAIPSNTTTFLQNNKEDLLSLSLLLLLFL